MAKSVLAKYFINMTDQEIKEKRLDNFRDVLMHAVRERYNLLPQISALAATLLVIATFTNVIQLTSFVRFLIVVLLLLIPVSLWGYLIALNQEEERAKKGLDELVNKKLTDKIKSNIFLAYLPWGIAAVITFVTVSIAFLVAKCG